MPSGSTTELNVADYFRASKMTFKLVIIEDVDQICDAFFAGRRDVYTGDAPRLYATRIANAPKPGDYAILPRSSPRNCSDPSVRTAITSSPTSCVGRKTP